MLSENLVKHCLLLIRHCCLVLDSEMLVQQLVEEMVLLAQALWVVEEMVLLVKALLVLKEMVLLVESVEMLMEVYFAAVAGFAQMGCSEIELDLPPKMAWGEEIQC